MTKSSLARERQRRTQSVFLEKLAYISRDRYLYALLAPMIIFYMVFAYKPMTGLQIAFQDFSPYLGINGSPWVGFEHFRTFLEGAFFWRTVKNTFVISICNIIFGFPMPIILALLFNELRSKKFRTVVSTISYLPYFISVVVVAGIVTNFLSPSYGIVNSIIAYFGGEKEYFLSRPQYFVPIFTTMTIWKESGFGSIIYFSALCSIDSQLYEAARIDGAGRFKQLLHVTLPGILPTIAIMLILKVGNLLNVGYESIILLYQPATYETADVISSYVFRAGLVEQNYSLSTAVGLFNGIAALVLVFFSNYISKRVLGTGVM